MGACIFNELPSKLQFRIIFHAFPIFGKVTEYSFSFVLIRKKKNQKERIKARVEALQCGKLNRIKGQQNDNRYSLYNIKRLMKSSKKALPYKSRRRYTTQYSKAEQYIIKL